MKVKANLDLTFAVERNVSRGWLIYLLFSIGVLGAVSAYPFCIPLYLLGLIWPPAQRGADFILVRGIAVLMRLQPWYRARIDLDSLQNGGDRFLTVSNHRSHLDAFILLSRVQGIRFFAKKTLFFVPFLGIMMRASRQIPVDRGNLQGFVYANEEMRRRLQRGERVHVFPEMTRCDYGQVGTLDFLLAPFHIAKQENINIVPIVFKNTDQVWPKDKAAIAYGVWVDVKALAPVPAANFASAELLRNEVRRRIDLELEKK